MARAIGLAFVPVLSRIFTPATYGEFGVLMAIASIVSCVGALRYDMALMLPKEESDAANILGLSVILIAGISAIAGIVFLAFGNRIGLLLRTPEIIPWLWLLPFSIFFMGLWQTLLSWSARRKQFHRASISQVAQALTGPGAQVSAGLAGANVFGLIIGRIIGDFCGTAVFARQVFKSDWPLIRGSLSLSRMKGLAREYKNFPLFAAPQSFMNTASQNVPALLLAYFFGVAVVGYYSIGVRIVQLPLQLVKGSLASVLFQKSSEVYNSGGDTYGLFKKTTLGLIGIVVLPSLLIALVAPTAAAIVLGEQWRTAGEYSRWLVLWMAVGFCNLPAVLFGQIYRRQRTLLCVEVVLLVFRVLAIVLGGMFCTALQTVILYSIVGIVYNTFLIAWVWWFMRQHSQVLAAESTISYISTPEVSTQRIAEEGGGL
ncbi:MAG: oligosaccharide flippase family protein [Pirellulales bacterium]|nr:oligosaccharide flippase family protein [Pirellulales bacterium]